MSISPAFLDELRARVPVSRIVGRKVTWDLRRSNQAKGDWWSPCPFHGEKTASFHVDDQKGFYYCFGCHAKGDALTFLREAEGLDFIEAVKVLASEAGLPMPEREPGERQRADRRTVLVDALEAATRHYRMQLSTGQGPAARDWMDLGRFPHRLVQVVRHLAQLGMGSDEGISYDPQNLVGLARCRQLIAERLPLPSLANADHTDAEGFEDATNVTFEVLAQPDQPFPRAYQAAKPVRLLAADVNRCEPTGARKLCQTFGVGGIRLVEPRRQALVCLPGINAGRRQAETCEAALQPDR